MTTWLIDKSAYVRLQLGQVTNRDQWSARIGRGLVRLSTITRLELGYSARSGEAGRQQFALPPLSLMPVEYLTPAIEDRALGGATAAGRPRPAPRPVDPRPAHRGDRREGWTDRPGRRQRFHPHHRHHRPTDRDLDRLNYPGDSCLALARQMPRRGLRRMAWSRPKDQILFLSTLHDH